ncbi:hypothetical protein HD554DRAFT_2055040 [Boletus coccyginus]|nr:hypothetical protein HD554DRAFT_2055040 [Boletus coccyginus]
MHNSLRIGRFWIHIKDYEHRAKCTHCDAPVENLEHILLSCPSPERLTVWDVVRRTWPTSHPEWQHPTLGQILGAGSISPPHTTDLKHITTEQARARLLRIIISESSHLIWVLRCERVISERSHNEKEIATRWLDKVNLRLNINRRRAKLPNRPSLSK